MLRRSAAVLPLACALMPACAPEPPPRTVVSYRIGGEDRLADQDQGAAALETAALADQAARDLGCSADRIRAEPRRPDDGVLAVEGCGARGVYLRISLVGRTRHVPGHEGRLTWLNVTRFVPLSGGDARRALDELRARPYPAEPLPLIDTPYPPRSWYYQIPATYPRYDHEEVAAVLEDWIALSRRGAVDLKCPRGEVIVGFRASGPRGATTPVAEGCGHRATYLRGSGPSEFDLISLVEITLPPP